VFVKKETLSWYWNEVYARLLHGALPGVEKEKP
jgi:hypothetical protein